MFYETIKNCRICGTENIKSVLDLGSQPPANSLRTNREERIPLFPLQLMICGHCATVQLSETVDPDYLFKNYVWVTGTARTSRGYSIAFSEEILSRCKGSPLFVFEVGSNDGTFLEPFQRKGHKVLGVDPAQNIAGIANDRGIPTSPGFFGLDFARTIVENHGKADCVIARNVIPHVKNVHDVIEGMAACMSDHGLGAIEFHYGKKIVDELQYDSIYHEHLCYYSLTSMSFLLKEHGLSPFDVIESPISGGALVVFFSKENRRKSLSLRETLANENDIGLNTFERWDRFAKECFNHTKRLKAIIEKQLERGATLIGYGASARSSTLLNFCGINSNHLSCIADQNELKHNKYTPGTDILIVPPSVALSRQPSAILLLAWNFQREILSILKEKHHFKGKVIIPLPCQSRIIEI